MELWGSSSNLLFTLLHSYTLKQSSPCARRCSSADLTNSTQSLRRPRSWLSPWPHVTAEEEAEAVSVTKKLQCLLWAAVPEPSSYAVAHVPTESSVYVPMALSVVLPAPKVFLPHWAGSFLGPGSHLIIPAFLSPVRAQHIFARRMHLLAEIPGAIHALKFKIFWVLGSSVPTLHATTADTGAAPHSNTHEHFHT